mgnify:CR=1 FL=1
MSKIMTIYLVIDMSESMTWEDKLTGKIRINTATSIFPVISEELDNDNTAIENLRLNVLGFNQEVHLFLRNAKLKDFDKWKNENLDKIKRGEGCTGQTYYGELFKKLKEYIVDDYSMLETEKCEYFRPLVYFLSDGKPEGEEESYIKNQYKALVTQQGNKERWNPSIFCIGMGDELSFKRIREYAAGKVRTQGNRYQIANGNMAFVVRKGQNVEDALKDLNHLVLKVIKDSLGTGKSNFSGFNSNVFMKKIRRKMETEEVNHKS